MPRILICTVDSWNTTISASSSSTFATLFSQYPQAELANIYLREEMPNSPVCGRYFQVSEQRVIKSLVKRTLKTGKEVCANHQQSQQDQDALQQSKKLYQHKRSYAKLFVRELIWKMGRWKTPELDRFLDDFRPEVVVFSMEGYIHLNRLCRYVLKRTGAKGIGYFWDDNFTYKQLRNNPGYTALRFFQRASLKKLARQCSAFWAIAPKMKEEADVFFGIDSVLLTKPVFFEEGECYQPYTVGEPVKMLYTGNLAIGRVGTILALSSALDRVNAHKVRLELDVYTPTRLSSEEQRQIGPYVHIHPPVDAGQVYALQKEADVLLFAEAMDGPMSKKARLSFSTKITDYLHAGKCILALGDGDTAPMAYLAQTGAAVCVTDKDQIQEALEVLLAEEKTICAYGRRAYQCAVENHAADRILARVDDTIQGVLNNRA